VLPFTVERGRTKWVEAIAAELAVSIRTSKQLLLPEEETIVASGTDRRRKAGGAARPAGQCDQLTVAAVLVVVRLVPHERAFLGTVGVGGLVAEDCQSKPLFTHVSSKIAALRARLDAVDRGDALTVNHRELVDKVAAVAQFIDRIPADIARYGERMHANTAALLRQSLTDDPAEFAEMLQRMFDGHDVIAESADGLASVQQQRTASSGRGDSPAFWG
jgi:hypothetical protein